MPNHSLINILYEQLLDPLLSFVFPEVCLACNKQLKNREHLICESCKRNLKPLESAILERLKTEIQPHAFDELVVVYEFGAVFQQLIHLLKYQRYLSLAAFFADRLYLKLHTMYDGICAVPLNSIRQRERGYNQSALMAQRLAEVSGWEYKPNLLVRTRNTPSQTKLNRLQRQKNMRNAFHCDEELKGLRLLLIDDVITTGSTLNACAAELKGKGAAFVDIAAIATPVDFFDEAGKDTSNSEVLNIFT